MTPRLSLVMPAYNEAAGITEAIAEAHEALTGLGYEFEILVIDDGSTDGTADQVSELTALWPHVRLLSHSMNLGYGAALRTGFESSHYDLVAFTDADGQFCLEDVDDLVACMDDFPVAVGWRIDRKDPWRRRFLSWGYNVLARAVIGTGVRDCDCALKVFRREALAYLLPESTGFFVNSEMLCKARQFGFAVAQVGVRHRSRRNGASKVSLFEVPKTFSTLLRFWWRQVLWAKPMSAPRFADPVVLPFPRTSGAPQRRAA